MWEMLCLRSQAPEGAGVREAEGDVGARLSGGRTLGGPFLTISTLRRGRGAWDV